MSKGCLELLELLELPLAVPEMFNGSLDMSSTKAKLYKLLTRKTWQPAL
jgi:hypothetical protein